MEKPNKEDYDFNDIFEAARFAGNIIKYVEYLEARQSKLLVNYHNWYLENRDLVSSSDPSTMTKMYLDQ